MCGVLGIWGTAPVNQAIYDGLTMIQHRGQDAAGIMTSDGKKVFLRKGNGLVRDVVHTSHMLTLKGTMGLGHVRYPTAGTPSAFEAQPIYVNSPYGLAIVHNGNLVNVDALRADLIKHDKRHLNTDSDSEVLLNIFAHELAHLSRDQALSPELIFETVRRVHKRCQGGYAVIIMIVGVGLVAFRDPNGIRALIWGKRPSQTVNGVSEYMIASESVALDALGFSVESDVLPGEAVFIDDKGDCHRAACIKPSNTRYSPCLFEYVYLARPDSVIDKISVYQARLRMGEHLARRILAERPDHDIDVVVPVPDTSRTAALPLARLLNVPYREGFVKNRYIGRTFIMPGQAVRRRSVRQKLNVIKDEFKGKRVLLVDDSIVRGTTSKEVVQMTRKAGAEKIYFASVAPLVRYPNVYGIDMPSASELIAHERNAEEIARFIGADWLIFQTLDDLYKAVSAGNPEITQFEGSLFTGQYVAGDVNADYLAKLAEQRQDKNRRPSQYD